MTPQDIGRLIQQERQKKGWTQAMLGDRAGISRQTISKIEQGRWASVAMASFYRMIAALDLEIDLVHVQRKRLWTPEELLE
jgi:HTH-type transcriptional regulator/antitoxin HipB